MEKRCWAVQIEGIHHIIEIEHESHGGTIWVDDRLFEKWILHGNRDSHHLFFIKGRRIGLHIFYQPESNRYRYDLSVNGVSVIDGRDVPPYRSTSSSGIVKSWDVRLSGGIYTITFRHELYGKRIVEIDGTVVEESRVHQEEESQHLILWKGHQLGIHLKPDGKEKFFYDLSVDGISWETGFPVHLKPTPSEVRKKAWNFPLQGRFYTVMMEHRGLWNEKRILVDGNTVFQTDASLTAGKDAQHAFTVGNVPCWIRIKRESTLCYHYDLIIDGFSVITGQEITVNAPLDIALGEVRSWTLKLGEDQHKVVLEHRGPKGVITLDGVVVGEKKYIKSPGDSCHFLKSGSHDLVMLITRKGRFEYRFQLFLDGTCVDTGESLLPLKVVDRDPWWMFQSKDGVHMVQVEYNQQVPIKRRIWVDNHPVEEKREVPLSNGTGYTFRIGGSVCALKIYESPDGMMCHDLFYNGSLVERPSETVQSGWEALPEATLITGHSTKPREPWLKRFKGMLFSYMVGVF